MSRNGLIMGIAAVLVGITTLMLIVGVVVNPFFLFVALPFGGAAYLMWYQASGKLADRIRANPAGYARSTRGDGGPGGFDAGPFEGGRFTRERVRENRRRARGQRGQGRRARGAGSVGQPTGLSKSEAADILGVDTGADEGEIKAAYREKVKTAHPDAPEGDEEEFKSVKNAYETLGE
ncbi:J domain-containing protein [Halonotius terrestris]|uniref:J domain-containing protein n=1 Tax=Halonotius terrestris TaxID=2487750 RepID=A0A8J8TCN5_9EURY|nr:J domain-containing protein [Halonotius terrestris]TQQ81051.1 J domain-containing protein [Halonotius terrestris]